MFAVFDPEGKGQSSKPGAEHQDRREFILPNLSVKLIGCQGCTTCLIGQKHYSI